MGNWTREVLLDPIEFDGDIISVTVKRLLASDMDIVLHNYDSSGSPIATPVSMTKLAAELVPKYLVKLEGMVQKDGLPFTLEDFKQVCGDYYFAPLIGKIYGGILRHGSLSAEQLKNFMPPAQESSGV